MAGITNRKMVKSKASSTQPTQAAANVIHCPRVGSRHQAISGSMPHLQRELLCICTMSVKRNDAFAQLIDDDRELTA